LKKLPGVFLVPRCHELLWQCTLCRWRERKLVWNLNELSRVAGRKGRRLAAIEDVKGAVASNVDDVAAAFEDEGFVAVD